MFVGSVRIFPLETVGRQESPTKLFLPRLSSTRAGVSNDIVMRSNSHKIRNVVARRRSVVHKGVVGEREHTAEVHQTATPSRRILRKGVIGRGDLGGVVDQTPSVKSRSVGNNRTLGQVDDTVDNTPTTPLSGTVVAEGEIYSL